MPLPTKKYRFVVPNEIGMFFSFPASEIILLVSTFFTWIYLMLGFAGNLKSQTHTDIQPSTIVSANTSVSNLHADQVFTWGQKAEKCFCKATTWFYLSVIITPVSEKIPDLGVLIFDVSVCKEFLRRAPPIS